MGKINFSSEIMEFLAIQSHHIDKQGITLNSFSSFLIIQHFKEFSTDLPVYPFLTWVRTPTLDLDQICLAYRHFARKCFIVSSLSLQIVQMPRPCLTLFRIISYVRALFYGQPHENVYFIWGNYPP